MSLSSFAIFPVLIFIFFAQCTNSYADLVRAKYFFDKKVLQSREVTKSKEVLAVNLVTKENNLSILEKDGAPKTGDVLNEDDALILQVNLGNRFIINDFLVGYLKNGQIFLPISTLMQALEFPIKLDDNATKAEGWFIAENRRFLLDTTKNALNSNKKQYSLDVNSFILFGQEIYVTTGLIEKVFPLQLSYDSLNQILKIKPLESLPIEQRLEREEKWNSMESNSQFEGSQSEADRKIPLINNPYKLASLPLMDVRMKYGYSKSADDDKVSTSGVDLLMNGDLLYLNNTLYANIVDKKLTNVRLTAGRKDANAKLLGPLRATEFSIGDVYTPQLPLTLRSQSGKGATITNYPDNYITEFNTTLIRGNIPAGWEIELYREDTLLFFQTVGNNGIYEFPNVPLLSGQNTIKLVFYGPFGQRREEIRRFLVNDEIIKKNKFYYRFATNKQNKDLIKLNEEDTSQDTDGKDRYFGEIAYGLTKNTSIVTSLSQVTLPNEINPRQYASASLRSSFHGVYGRYDLIKDLSYNKKASEFSLQTNINDYNINAVYDKFDKDFVSEERQQTSEPNYQLSDKLNLKVDFPLYLISKSTRLSIDATREMFRSSSKRDVLRTDLSSRIGRNLNISQNFTYEKDKRLVSEENPASLFKGNSSISYRISDKLTLRGNSTYQINPSLNLESTTISSDYRFKDEVTLNLSATHPSTDDGVDSYNASISKNFKNYIASIGTNYYENGAYSAELNLSFAIGYDPKFKTSTMSPIPIADSGVISAKVFLDSNNNAIHDKGEKLLQGIGFATNNGSSRQVTDERGTVMIDRVPVGYPVKIKLDVDGLGDPYLVAQKSEYRIVSHAGSITNIDFPISQTGDIEGYVELVGENGRNAAANVILELSNEKDEIVSSTRTAYDGYYVFETVPYGTYKIHTSQSQLARLDKNSRDSHLAILNDSNSSINGLNFAINEGYEDQKGLDFKGIGGGKYAFDLGIISKGSDVVKYIYEPLIRYQLTGARDAYGKVQSQEEEIISYKFKRNEKENKVIEYQDKSVIKYVFYDKTDGDKESKSSYVGFKKTKNLKKESTKNMQKNNYSKDEFRLDEEQKKIINKIKYKLKKNDKIIHKKPQKLRHSLIQGKVNAKSKINKPIEKYTLISY